ncbi:sugar ABC transporter ATP-binding protein [Cetobacterium somerae]|uniref:sugar ABC transporter ATP-binding protein n=1 Tax=Cetobacterium somerae TaxID=188913 RepID=UPI002E7BD45D|nr:sugar ABC transporter ATP-binding protein [Cetobacterium somerae]WVJ01641.1 sugar ABC transporter ATP-binding protein [Cetobacterium somerae]
MLSSKENTPMLSIKEVHKSFGENKVLKGIDLEIYKGDVISIIGGNGAGKSTLMKILMGIYDADCGKIFINGKLINLSTPSLAISNGIYLVPQEPMLFQNMSIFENIIIGIIGDKNILLEKVDVLTKKFDWKVDLKRKAYTLSIAEQQIVEILRGLLRKSKILILDEPTSTLTFKETKLLFEIIEDLKKDGVGIFYITHRLSEVFQITNKVVVMCDGKITLSGKTENFTKEMLVNALLNNKKDRCYEKLNFGALGKDKIIELEKNKILEVKNYSGYGFTDLNFSAYSGEILGIAGVIGAGRTEFATTLFGMDKVLKGDVYLEGKNITGKTTKEIIMLGINYVPEDRYLNGIFKIIPISINTTSSILGKISRVFINKKIEKQVASKYINDFNTKITSLTQEIGELSGGNQQKVIIGRALSTNPKILILDEPTRGIDAGARIDVYNIIKKLKEEGVGIILISSDLDEIVELADKAIVMNQGKIEKKFLKSEIYLDNLMKASYGI